MHVSGYQCCHTILSFLPALSLCGDSVAVAVRIFVNGSVEVASRDYEFYDCAAAVRKAENTP